jgi:hypothetical protein
MENSKFPFVELDAGIDAANTALILGDAITNVDVVLNRVLAGIVPLVP